MSDDLSPEDVIRVEALPLRALDACLCPYGLSLAWVPRGAAIPGSYWGDAEAGLIGNLLHLRPDTPVHSALHEAAHFICVDAGRRAQLHTDAGGDDQEESAVCYLQALLAARLAGYSRERLFLDMDRWGYSFRLGSARDWFERDAEDARTLLVELGLCPETNVDSSPSKPSQTSARAS